MAAPLQWEHLVFMDRDREYRAKVPGGWLVKIEHVARSGGSTVGGSVSVTFIPDPNHEWSVE